MLVTAVSTIFGLLERAFTTITSIFELLVSEFLGDDFNC